MTLTHDEIAGMTCKDVNEEIGIYLGTINIDCTPPQVPDYCHDWSHAGRLLEMFDDFALSKRGNVSECSVFTERGDIDHTAPTAPEAIARCWLEWWEVTHE